MHLSRSLVAVAAFALLAGCGVEESEFDSQGEELEENTAEAEQALYSAKIWFTSGDGVNVRTGPGTGFGIVKWLAEGTAVGIDCQTTGTTVNGTNIWDYLPGHGGYVTDAYVLTGYDGFIPGVPQCGGGGGSSLVVNGNVLNADEDKWVRWIATNTIPKLSGTRDQRLDKASRVAWWSLKEGVLDYKNPNPLAYSNCNQQNFSVTYVCPVGYAWQAGIAGVQPRNHTLAQTENVALTVYPGSTISSVLAKAATQAGYASGTTTYNTIVNSTGDLRNSWLLRESATGFTSQHPLVYDQCVVNSQVWCYSSAWAESAKFAPTKSAALKSISDLRAIFNTLAP
jgi:hypothetical protein